MKYQRSEAFVADYRRLGERERALFKDAVSLLNEAYERRSGRPLPHWPAVLRIKPVRSASGVFELTWSFAGPDGRATFEFGNVGGEIAIRWRRIGDHRVLHEP